MQCPFQPVFRVEHIPRSCASRGEGREEEGGQVQEAVMAKIKGAEPMNFPPFLLRSANNPVIITIDLPPSISLFQFYRYEVWLFLLQDGNGMIMSDLD